MDGSAAGLFAAFKSLGEVCSDDVPISVRPKGGGKRKSPVILAAVSNVVHQYNARTLRLTSVSEPLGARVTCVAADRTITFAGLDDGQIHALRNNRQIMHTYSGEHTSAIHKLLPFGDHIISLEQLNVLCVWDTHSADLHCRIELDIGTCLVTAICHPLTMLNKALLGTQQGTLRLINLKTARVVHVFETDFHSPIVCLQQSPAVGVVAVGLEDGRCVLHNIEFDETVFAVKQDWGSVDCISFRLDGVATMMTAGGDSGHLAIWDLEKRQLVGQLTDAHDANVTTICALPAEPIVITSGADNCVKTWIFDQPDGLARQLALREGPAKQSQLVRFLDATGEMLISASADGRLRVFSSAKDTKQQCLGMAGTVQRSVAKKRKMDLDKITLPPASRLSVSLGREANWDNVVCTHEGRINVTTWSTRACKLGQHKMIHERFKVGGKWPKAHATDACVTQCGNFALVAYSSGHVDVWNMQSGLHRGALVDPRLHGDLAHDSPVSAVCTDATNVRALTADRKGRLKIWWFAKRKLSACVQLTACEDVGLCRLTFNRDNDLFAAACAKGTIFIGDVECGRVVRKFTTEIDASSERSHEITDLVFSSFGDWLLSVSKNPHVMRVWHLPTGKLIDALRFGSPCISVDFSPSGQFIATCHEGERAVFLWANRSVFDSSVNTARALPNDFLPQTATVLPNSRPAEEPEVDSPLNVSEPMETTVGTVPSEDVSAAGGEVQQLGSQLATLSGLAEPRWASLPHLEEIRRRNKAKEPVRKPQRAPFFLPTVATLDDFVFDPTAVEKATLADGGGPSTSRVLQQKRAFLEPTTKWARSLKSSENASDRRNAFDKLKQMGPSAIDNEFRLMVVVDEQENKATPIARNMLLMLCEGLESGVDFELAHAYLAAWLKIHFSMLAKLHGDDEFVQLSQATRDAAANGWERLGDTLVECMAVVQWIKSAAI